MDLLTASLIALVTMMGSYQAPAVEQSPSPQAGVEQTAEELPECQSYEEEEAGGCTPPPMPEGKYFYFETEDQARAEMGWDVPCWGELDGTWSCWIGE